MPLSSVSNFEESIHIITICNLSYGWCIDKELNPVKGFMIIISFYIIKAAFRKLVFHVTPWHFISVNISPNISQEISLNISLNIPLTFKFCLTKNRVLDTSQWRMKKEKTTLAANPKLEDSEDTTGSVSLWRGAAGSVGPAGATAMMKTVLIWNYLVIWPISFK